MIANFRINKMVGEKTSEEDIGKVNMKPNFRIASLKKESDERLGDYVTVNFEFEGAYDPDIGNIKLDGNLMYYDSKFDEMVHEKKKEIELEPEAIEEIMNFVLQNSIDGADDTLTPMLITMLNFWMLQVPLAFLLPRFTNLDVYGVRWAVAIGIIAGAVAYVIYFRLGRWKRKKI